MFKYIRRFFGTPLFRIGRALNTAGEAVHDFSCIVYGEPDYVEPTEAQKRITTAFVEQYRANVYALVEQRGSKLRARDISGGG